MWYCRLFSIGRVLQSDFQMVAIVNHWVVFSRALNLNLEGAALGGPSA
jgi:hypothetical protein